MFAVPGWSVSADGLKAETPVQANGDSQDSKSKKRKRANASSAQQESVTSSNIASLWTSVVEGKTADTSTPDRAAAKKRRKAEDKSISGLQDRRLPAPFDDPSSAKTKQDSQNEKTKGKDEKRKRKDEKQERKDEKQKQKQKQGKASDGGKPEPPKSESLKAEAPTVTAAAPPLPPAPPKLTPLQASMRQKLISARFRHLNETLYTRPSEDAFSLFQESPEMFEEYHEGFRRQVKVWPENPVDSFLKDIRSRGKAKTPGKGKPSAPAGQLARLPLPRTAGTCTIADLGCGEAQLAQSLKKDKHKLHLQVHSYDLQSPHPLITKADIANLPLEDGSVNVAIFCLALMGTNWVDFIEEAYRVLHWKGELWVSEIKSRFGLVRGKNTPVNHSVGARKKKPAGKNGKANDGGYGELAQDLSVEVDGADDLRRETDVSAFVDVLKRRGFVLQGERSEAIDLSNKMFVKMHFIKAASPTKGKGAKAQEPKRGAKEDYPGWKARGEDEEVDIDEASILKPCVYKIR